MLNFMTEPLEKLEEYKIILSNYKLNKKPILTYGLINESLGHFIYSINKDIKSNIIVITETEKDALYLYNDLIGLGLKNVEYYPGVNPILYDVEASSKDEVYKRIEILNKITFGEKTVVVLSFRSLLDKIISKKIYIDNTINISYDNQIIIEKLKKKLDLLGYERVSKVESKGQYSIRGGIIDIYSANYEDPYRVELFGDEIDSIRSFDVASQRSIKNIKEIVISPVSEVIMSDNIKDDILKKLYIELEKTDNENFKLRLEHEIEKIKNDMRIKNFDFIKPYISDKYLGSLLDYANDDFIFFHEYESSINRVNKESKGYLEKLNELVKGGYASQSHKNLYWNHNKLLENIKAKTFIVNNSLLENKTNIDYYDTLKFNIKSTINYQNNINVLLSDILKYIDINYRVIILVENMNRAKRLKKRLIEEDLDVSISEEYTSSKNSNIIITIGCINKGFEYIDSKTVLISEKQVFKNKLPKKRKKREINKNREKIVNLSDLEIDSYVVHEDHGIGLYGGIEQLEVQGAKKDYITVRYKDGDKLYIPIDQMNLIQKYIGSDSKKPKINKLNSNDWKNTKIRAKKAVEDMAKDLLKLYAKRETSKGHKFSKDTPWQQEFEDSFPYEETVGQLAAIEDIKKDMEKEKPMERLLCADVGYGKTEVALRAAFKAIMDGKQVAFLVPTTILAQQHYETILDRFKNFPINIEILSRFKTEKEQNEIVSRLKLGEVDLIVGTHRLLSKDVAFKDLGLLIIDEEQRFGVKDKEKIKQIRSNVDVLILTATPIPRTLHMSLSGIRDMSTIEEPPENRYPIQTYVLEYNSQLIRDVILKEYSRGGQVYFVYNRVKNINNIANHIRDLVPEVDVGVAHGQMNEKTLENEMLSFANREKDVLVCTTIIETGLDLPNVNTIIIYDADKMGLSQLYQLRGRVGRSNRIAYSYFTYKQDKLLTNVAEKRLRAIKEFTEFGSGFKIAMRDLEIRGAGNLLGTSQHGHIEAIGYDLYIKFLNSAIQKLKGLEMEENLDTNIDLNIDAYIPKGYISDANQKIEIYKKIAILNNDKDYDDLTDELIDRFGDIPKEIRNLMDISIIKSIASKNYILNIEEIKNDVRFDLKIENKLTPEKINYLDNKYNYKIRFDLSMKPAIILSVSNKNKLLEIKEFLLDLDALNNAKSRL